ncbi:MAG: caspase family protein [Methylococcaceae bacterium]
MKKLASLPGTIHRLSGSQNRLLAFSKRIVLWLFTLMFITPSLAEKHALLIGVTYPNLSESQQLKGPVNDINLMRKVLLERGFPKEAIHMLSDGIKGAEPPTRATILKAFQSLTDKVNKDDFVFLHFAGHGSQQPAKKDNQETDGLDEIFLPTDIGRWNGEIGSIENAITDDEMRQLLARLQNKGAFVWAVFDQCHAGTMVRGETEHGNHRYINPQTLGVPQDLLKSKTSTKGIRGVHVENDPFDLLSDVSDSAGKSVIYYATQQDQIEPEIHLRGEQDGQNHFGLFTYRLAQTLEAYPNISYRQVGQRVLQLYAAAWDNRPTPLFTGSGIDAPVFGIQLGDAIRQWPIKKIENLLIEAGSLHQLSDGAILSIMPTPAAKDIIGYLRIRQAGLFKSIVEPIAYQDKPAVPIHQIGREAFARLVYANPSFTLRVAIPELTRGYGTTKVMLLIKQLKALGTKSIEWVDVGQDADLRLLVGDGRLWLLSRAATFIQKDGPNKTHSIDLSTPDRHTFVKINDSLRRIAKAVNLMRLANQLNDSVLTDKLRVTATIQRIGSQAETVFNPETIPRLNANDVIRFNIVNHSKGPVDVTLLFLNSEYGIDVMFPKPNQINRLETEGKISERFRVTNNTRGLERLLLIAVKGEKYNAMSDFSFLAQDGIPRYLNERAAAQDQLTDEQNQIQAIFAQAGFGNYVRSRFDPKIFQPTRQTLEKALTAGFSWTVE